MKRKIVILAAVLLTVTAGILIYCTQTNKVQASGSYSIYYIRLASEETQQSLLATEPFSPDSGSDEITELIKAVLSPPKSEGLQCSFQTGTTFKSYTLENGLLTVDLGGAYGDMLGVNLTSADSCLILTLCQVQGVDSVRITVDGAPHPNRQDRALGADDIVIGELSLQSIEQDITLWFADGDKRYLHSEVRMIVAHENEKTGKYIVEELIKGPKTDGLLGVIPDGTRLLSLTMESNICYVNLSGEFVSNQSADMTDQILSVSAIVDSLTELSDIDSVQILIDGAVVEQYLSVPIGQPISRDTGILWREYPQSMTSDVNVYYPSPDDKGILGTPRIIITSENTREERLALDVLIGGEVPWWSYNPVPQETRITAFSIENGLCRLTLSREFLDNHINTQHGEYMTLSCIVSTLTEYTDINAVRISVEGQEGDFSFYTLKQSLTKATFLQESAR